MAATLIDKPVRCALAALACGFWLGQADAETSVANVRQGTNMSLALSPDGETLVLDLLGGLWRLPASGGDATPLVRAGDGARNPRFSPDGQRIVYQRLSDGQWDLWLLDLDDGRQRRLTRTGYDEREPDFSADGKAVIFSSNRTGLYSLWSLDLDGDVLTQLTIEAGDSFYPSVSPQGEIAYVHFRAGQWSLRRLADGARGEVLISSANVLSAPSWRPGQGVLLYNERDASTRSALKMLLTTDRDEPIVKTLTRNEDVFPARAAWRTPAEYLYTADGRVWRRSIASLSRQAVPMSAAVAMDRPETPSRGPPLDAAGPHPVVGSVGQSVSADGSQRVFAALGDLWLSDNGELRRLTDDAAVDIDPSFVPGSAAVVFASDRGGNMDLWQLDLASGEMTRLSREPEKAYRPAIDPSGQWVAYLVTDGFGRWSQSALRLLRLDSRARPLTLAEGLYDTHGLRWLGDAGEPRLAVEARIEDGGSAGWLGFAVDGEPVPLDTIPVADAQARPLPARPQLTWTPAAPAEAYAIQVGRLFDGIRNDYRRHVDIHVEGQRITAIVGRGQQALPAHVIDAREATVIPGLIDAHAHQSALLGERLGRIWLVNGVTTVHEVGGDWAEAIERAESWSSGRRPGPRLVISPSDGSSPELGQRAARPIVVNTAPLLSAGLAHEVRRQWRQMSAPNPPGVSRLELLPAQRTAPADWRLLISPLNASYQDVVGIAVESGGYLTTGLAALAGLPPAVSGPSSDWRQLYDDRERGYWAGGSAPDDRLRPLQTTLARVLRDGGKLAAGSDAPAVPYGYGLHAELLLLGETGIANDQILRLATAEAAAALGLDAELGTLEAGKLADFVVLNGDPLQRLSDSRAIVAVVKGGVWFERDALLQRP